MEGKNKMQWQYNVDCQYSFLLCGEKNEYCKKKNRETPTSPWVPIRTNFSAPVVTFSP